MFGFKKDVSSNICTSADSRLIALGGAPDQVFASKVLGDNVVTEMADEEICALCDRRLVMLADIKHIFGMSADNGVGVPVHTGLDAVELNGTGLMTLRAADDRAKKGTPIIRLGREFFQSQNACLITPMLISNSVGCPLTPEITGKEVVAKGSVVIRSQQKRGRVMQIIKKVNNSVVTCLGNNNHELIAFDRGVGFLPTPYELNNTSKVDRIYYEVNSLYLELINKIPENIFKMSVKIVDMAVNYIDCELSSNLVFTLADHINLAIGGNRANMSLKNPFLYDIQYFYEKETDIDDPALKMIRRYLKVNLSEEEVRNTTSHFINAEVLNEKDKEFNFGDTIIEEVTHLIEKELDIRIKREDFSYSRFVSHLQYLIKREDTARNVSNDNIKLYMKMKQEFPQIYQCVPKIRDYTVKRLEWELNEEERLYLILHVNRPYAREDCNR